VSRHDVQLPSGRQQLGWGRSAVVFHHVHDMLGRSGQRIHRTDCHAARSGGARDYDETDAGPEKRTEDPLLDRLFVA
jgi:hypothetical protein